MDLRGVDGRAAGVVPRHPHGNRASEAGDDSNWLKINSNSHWTPDIPGRGVSSIGTKGASGTENSFRTARCVRKTEDAGQNNLAKRLAGKTDSEKHPDSP